MASYKKLGKDMLLMTIGSLGSKILAFLLVPLYTTVLSTAEYGISDLITTTVSLCFPFFTLIISEPLLQFSLNKENNTAKIWFIAFRIWLIGTLVMFLFSPIVFFTPLKEYYGFVVAYYIGYSMYNILSYFMRGVNKVKIFSISGVINSAAIIGLNIFFLLVLKIGIVGYLLSQIIASGVACVYIVLAGGVYRYGLQIRNVDKVLQKKMLAYSIPMIPNSVSWWISNASDRFILTFFSGVSVTGIYSVAYKIPTIISMFSSIFNSAWRLSAADEFGSKKSRDFFGDVYSKLTVLLLLLSSLLIAMNKPLASILFARDFYAAWKCVPVLLLSAAFHSFADFFGTIYTTSYKTKYLFQSTLIGAGTNIILNFSLIPFWGAFGAAIATLISYMAVWLFRILHSRKIIKIEYHLRRDIACYALVFLQLLISGFTLKCEIVIATIIFLLLLILTRKELSQLLKMFLVKLKRK